MSLDDRDEVPLARSAPSIRATFSPREAASTAAPAPVTPPPTMSTSKVSSRSRCRSASRRCGDRAPAAYRDSLRSRTCPRYLARMTPPVPPRGPDSHIGAIVAAVLTGLWLIVVAVAQPIRWLVVQPSHARSRARPARIRLARDRCRRHAARRWPRAGAGAHPAASSHPRVWKGVGHRRRGARARDRPACYPRH